MHGYRARCAAADRVTRRESVRQDVRRAILTLDRSTSYMTWRGTRIYMTAAFAPVIARPVEVEAPRTGPGVDRRTVERSPRCTAREVYATAGVGPCWPDLRAGTGSVVMPP